MSSIVISSVSSDCPVKCVDGFAASTRPWTSASRGITTLSPMLIALSSVPRKVSPTFAVSELSGSVRRTEMRVPAGTVTVTGAAGGAGVLLARLSLLFEDGAPEVLSLYVWLGFVELERAGLLRVASGRCGTGAGAASLPMFMPGMLSMFEADCGDEFPEALLVCRLLTTVFTP